jgi:transglutaminase-like putative cysteine protease
MLIRIGYDITVSFPAPTPVIHMLYLHPTRKSSVVKPEQLILEPNVPMDEFIDSFGNRCGRFVAPAGRLRLYNDAIVQDSGMPDATDANAVQHSLVDLPADTLGFLLPSRYCEVEKLSDIAWNLFGNTPLGWPRVRAICDWAHERITFGYAFARGDRTAYEAYVEQRGVCRDYMHLAITLCRCMGIPARYATGYLGDICVPPVPFPMDFSAWFEVYVGGQWYTLDARHNQPRVGRVLMARGRDAADVALFTTFGRHVLENFHVWTDEVGADVMEKEMRSAVAVA